MARAFWECDLEDARMAPSSLWVREMYTRPPLFFVTVQSKELSGGKRCSAKGATHTPRISYRCQSRGITKFDDCKRLKTQGGNRAWQKPDGALK